MKSYRDVTGVSLLFILVIKGTTTHLWIYKTQIESPFQEITTPHSVMPSQTWSPGNTVGFTVNESPKPQAGSSICRRNLSAKACCPSLI